MYLTANTRWIIWFHHMWY